MRILFCVASALVLSAAPALAQTGRGGAGGYGGHMWNGWDGWGGWLMGVPGILFIVLLVVAIVLAIRWLGGTGGGGLRKRPDALEILRERYARGEIDRAEYEERRGVLDR